MTFPTTSGEQPEVADYMSSFETIAEIIGMGENGYGIPVPWSGPVSTGTRVNARDWTYLQRDLNSIYIHATGAQAATTVAITSATVVASTISNTIYALTNAIVADRYTCHPGQFYQDPVTSETWNTTDGVSTRNQPWDSTVSGNVITHKVNAAWTTRLTARYFFNQGGYFIYKPFHLNDGSNALDTQWANFINYVQGLGGFEYRRDAFVGATQPVTQTWSSGSLKITVLAQKNASEDSVLFTIKYKNPDLAIVPPTGFWNVVVA